MIFVTLHEDTLFVGIFLRNLFERSIKKFKQSGVVSQKQQEEENDNDKTETNDYLV